MDKFEVLERKEFVEAYIQMASEELKFRVLTSDDDLFWIKS